MKNRKIIVSGVAFLMLCLVLISSHDLFSYRVGFDYKRSYDSSLNDGPNGNPIFCWIRNCTDDPGTDCTTPGSATQQCIELDPE
ncbi:hypothetical protein [Roseivirga echinicomitans]|uniref:Uncharacterized protein n=1 Tax=Roseivirga echinicomitans TaxID=296218 RepID=A0A150XE14_9BACT|nr:hypothetical protein [Roseivirga echinicomitans]KYG76989.1 hypothetical protein AWN68_18375 [Roseivirga echinicomitans]